MSITVWSPKGYRHVKDNERWTKRCTCGNYIPLSYDKCDRCLEEELGLINYDHKHLLGVIRTLRYKLARARRKG